MRVPRPSYRYVAEIIRATTWLSTHKHANTYINTNSYERVSTVRVSEGTFAPHRRLGLKRVNAGDNGGVDLFPAAVLAGQRVTTVHDLRRH